MVKRFEKFIDEWSKPTLLIVLLVLYMWGVAWAADTALSGLTADTAPTSDDLVLTTNDPGGTPASRKVTLSNLAKAFDGATPRANMGLAIGTDVQAYGANTDTDSTDDYTVGGTDVAVTDGGTGSSTAAGARSNLGAGTMDDVVDDTTPQSGGDHDLNGHHLLDATGIDDDDCTGDQGKFWWDPIDNQWEGCNDNSGTPVVLGASASGDITGVLGDTSGEVPVLFQTASAFTASDATPDVSTKTFWITADTTTYTDFDGTPVDGQLLFIYCAHAATFDMTSSGIEAWNRTTDLTATVGFVANLMYSTNDNQWHFLNAPSDDFEASATPKATLDDSDGADGYWDVNANDADDAVATFGVDDSGGDDQPYIEMDGVNERIEFKKQVQDIELGHASDTTIARSAAGEITIEGSPVAKRDNEICSPPIILAEPDQLQPIADAWQLMYFPAEQYPYGVTITAIHISTSATCTDALNFEEWSNNGTAWSTDSTVEAITLSGTFTEDDGTLSDSAIAADAYLYVDLPATPTDIGSYEITVCYTRDNS